MADLDLILSSLRTLLLEHVAATQALTAGTAIGDTVVNVPNTARFRAGDDVLILSDTAGLAEKATIQEISGFDTITLQAGLTRAWPLGESPRVLKAPSHLPVKRIAIGDLRVIPSGSTPMITISPANEDNEWITLRATSHEFRVNIRVYVQTDNFETSELLVTKYAELVREVLLDHIHPFIDGEVFGLTDVPAQNPIPAGSTVISISDTSKFEPRRIAYLRDAGPSTAETFRPIGHEVTIRAVLSPTDLEIAAPTQFDVFAGRQGELILVNRYLYDTRPSSINYGYVPGSGGSFVRAAELSWFGKLESIREGNILS